MLQLLKQQIYKLISRHRVARYELCRSAVFEKIVSAFQSTVMVDEQRPGWSPAHACKLVDRLILGAFNGRSWGTQGRLETAEGSTERARQGAGGGAEAGKVVRHPGPGWAAGGVIRHKCS